MGMLPRIISVSYITAKVHLANWGFSLISKKVLVRKANNDFIMDVGYFYAYFHDWRVLFGVLCENDLQTTLPFVVLMVKFETVNCTVAM